MNPEKKHKIAVDKARRENREVVGTKHFRHFKQEHGELKYKKIKGRIVIDIDDFIDRHKLFNFNIIDPPFSNRLYIKKEINDTDLPLHLTKAFLHTHYSMNAYQVKKMRESGLVKHHKEIIKNVEAYVYSREDVIKYADLYHFMFNGEIIELTNEPMFYKVEDIQEKIRIDFNISVDLSTINRKITETKEIPAVRVGTLLRIPIQEFNELEIENVFQK